MSPPRFKVPSKWGLCFAGNEQTFCAALDLGLAAASAGVFTYLEIGLGYGDTMRSVQEYVSQAETGGNVTFIGVDIRTCYPGASRPDCYPFPAKTVISLSGAANFLAENILIAHAVFIDGCHGAPCVTADFRGIERMVAPGGVVIFHDTDPGCQGIHFQEHCQSGIEARSAVEALGLLDDKRPGWKFVTETTGDKEKGGHGILVVQREHL